MDIIGPFHARLERAFTARLSELPDEAPAALLVSALQDGDRFADTAAAIAVLSRQMDVNLEPAFAAGLITRDGETLRFRHPLVRSVVVQPAPVEARRAAHLALAASLVEDPDRVTWHRSLAADGLDEGLAAELETGAERAIARRESDVAVQRLERAAALSSDPLRRSHCLVLAAELAFELAGLLRQAGEEIAAGQGQTQARWQLLSVTSDPPLSVPQAARRLGISRQAVQRVANDLVADGLAEFTANPDHRTSPLLALTDSGDGVLAEISGAASQFNRELAGALGERRVTALRRGVGTALESLRAGEISR